MSLLQDAVIRILQENAVFMRSVGSLTQIITQRSQQVAETRTIRVSFINPPKENKVNFSVKAADNSRYSVKPEIAHEMEVGKTYVCQVVSKDFGNGAVWFIERIKAAPQQTPPQGQASTDDPTAKNIFVTGIVGRAMGSGKFGAEDVLRLTQAALGAFDLLNGKVAAKKFEAGIDIADTFDDDLPEF